MDGTIFVYGMSETAGGATARLELKQSSAVLDFRYKGMGNVEILFQLDLNHEPVNEHTGLLYVVKATGSIKFPHPTTEFGSSDLLLEYICLPGANSQEAENCSDSFDLFLFLTPELSDLLHHKVAGSLENADDLEMLDVIYQLEKTRFKRTEN
ncbi:hypothetical protein GC197_10505 [bacterium]|nr:hypothetical protein [bacterium]